MYREPSIRREYASCSVRFLRAGEVECETGAVMTVIWQGALRRPGLEGRRMADVLISLLQYNVSYVKRREQIRLAYRRRRSMRFQRLRW